MSNFPQDRFGKSLFLGSGVPHFHHIRHGDSLLLESGHAPFPPKRIWKVRNPTKLVTELGNSEHRVARGGKGLYVRGSSAARHGGTWDLDPNGFLLRGFNSYIFFYMGIGPCGPVPSLP